jgi:hypothetical protein
MRRGLKFAVIAVIGGVCLGVAAEKQPMLKSLYQQVFPGVGAMRQALNLCFFEDHQFNRLVSAERKACYDHVLSPPAADTSAGELSTHGVTPNFVDLRRAAGRGSVPRNDIRVIQLTDGSTR